MATILIPSLFTLLVFNSSRDSFDRSRPIFIRNVVLAANSCQEVWLLLFIVDSSIVLVMSLLLAYFLVHLLVTLLEAFRCWLQELCEEFVLPRIDKAFQLSLDLGLSQLESGL